MVSSRLDPSGSDANSRISFYIPPHRANLSYIFIIAHESLKRGLAALQNWEAAPTMRNDVQRDFTIKRKNSENRIY
jgi:hypothetical protein